VTFATMSKRKSTGDNKIPSKDKMDVDGEDSGSDDVYETAKLLSTTNADIFIRKNS
jgi:hypothetical protein